MASHPNNVELMTNDAVFITQDGQFQLAVTLEQDTVWLNQAQMCELFDKNKRTISEHIRNIFKEGELVEGSVVRNFRTTASDGKNYGINYYNLDVIISVGYRVKSQRGVLFRQWATKTLNQHLIEGYTLNQQRLAERGVEFNQALSLLSQTLTNQALITREGSVVVNVIADYARSWSLLQGYDEQSLNDATSKQQQMVALKLDDVLLAISTLKNTLMKKGEATELFGQLRGNGLASSIATIEQGFGGEWFYPNVASRSAHLLYFIIKNHPLADGNKRTGSFLFLWYLQQNQHLLAKPVNELINDNTLVALALLLAESLPEQKELMIRLIEHFILLKDETAK
ncbi:virulence protein RhuM/Fic/DOC family protein [Vibrio sp. TH_r3]|uniref:virulence protein RhuM/Fic/DOC family protein n=1 Tax=Vibrio sp. TH_r3 TaxID=3082084 RepID=UPI002955CDD5|nr:virulence protein RhuM/Fic/DOC family protein [Vibrio sp. TH_r3]MDV7106251.1 virulence protein RhuM/Fic/DOC family protein [Vibrio sp. TH_r3]